MGPQSLLTLRLCPPHGRRPRNLGGVPQKKGGIVGQFRIHWSSALVGSACGFAQFGSRKCFPCAQRADNAHPDPSRSEMTAAACEADRSRIRPFDGCTSSALRLMGSALLPRVAVLVFYFTKLNEAFNISRYSRTSRPFPMYLIDFVYSSTLSKMWPCSLYLYSSRDTTRMHA